MKCIHILIVALTSIFTMCQAQTEDNKFDKLKDLFPKARGVINLKYEKSNYSGIDISKELALNILRVPQKQLKYIDVAYNTDTEEEINYNMETLPKAILRFSKDTIQVFVYYIEYNYNYSDDWEYNCYLMTTNSYGEIIDRKLIAREREQENQIKHNDAIILNDSTYKVFNYTLNEKHAIIMKGVYKLVDENEPETKVSIVEYRIKSDGSIVESSYKDVQYAKNPVLFYSKYHKDSDDPMNEYK